MFGETANPKSQIVPLAEISGFCNTAFVNFTKYAEANLTRRVEFIKTNLSRTVLPFIRIVKPFSGLSRKKKPEQ